MASNQARWGSRLSLLDPQIETLYGPPRFMQVIKHFRLHDFSSLTPVLIKPF